jgi:hypothetical protein
MFCIQTCAKGTYNQVRMKAQHIIVFVGYAKSSKVIGYGTQERVKLSLPQTWTSMKMHQ